VLQWPLVSIGPCFVTVYACIEADGITIPTVRVGQ
jgi:hypothetical protein